MAGPSRTDRRTAGGIGYSRCGSGLPVVLLHPIGLDRDWWREYEAAWSARFGIVAIDLRGHGTSDLVDGPVTLAAHANDVAEVLRDERLAATTLIGVSMGGMVAQRLAIDHRHLVDRMILVATAASFPDEVRPAIRARGDAARAGSMHAIADATIARWFLPASPRPDLVAACRQRLSTDDWTSWSRNWEAIAAMDHLAELETVGAETLVVAGTADASIPAAVSEQLACALPNARYATVAGASHFGAFEQPAAFRPVFEAFLANARQTEPH